MGDRVRQLDMFSAMALEAVREEEFIPDAPGSVWSAKERSAWAPPRQITVSDWALANRILSARNTADPGLWTDRAYQVNEIMNAFIDPQIERITIMAAAQSSKTEAVYNMLAYAICEDPAPALVVMPTIKTLKRVNKRILTMIKETPATARHLTGNTDDENISEITLDNMTIYFATAGSASDLRNVVARYVIMDETDGYAPDASGEGSPIEMAEARSTTYNYNRKVILLCTPTTENGYINLDYTASDRRRYWVPCPYCKGYQLLTLSRLKHRGYPIGKWPENLRDPEYIRRRSVAVYECEYCGSEIADRHRDWMLRYGTWLPEGHKIQKDGTCDIPRPQPAHVGYQWSAFYSPWRSFSEIAARFFSTKENPEKYQAFVNLWLAEPWVIRIITTEASEILKAKCSLPAQIVPQEAVALTCFIDRQIRNFWFAVRAWARDCTSWLIHYGSLATWDDVEALLFETSYRIQDSDMTMRIWRAAVDTGGGRKSENDEYSSSMTEETYWWLRENGTGRGCRVFGTKGSSSPLAGKVHVGKPLDKTPSGKAIPGGLQLILLDTHKLKDAYHYRLQLAAAGGGPQAAYLHSETDELYARHIAAEEKRRNSRGADEWVKIHKRNDLLDCECGCLALADPEWPGGGVNLIRNPNMPSSSSSDASRSIDNDSMRQNLSNRTINPRYRRR